jgi:Niemann-Pick C1 protein
MSVEFTAHFASFYMHAQGDTRRARAQEALTDVLPPTVNGAASSLLSLLILFASSFPFVRIYYGACWMFVVILSFLNGVITLPCLLSLFGPTRGRRFGD